MDISSPRHGMDVRFAALNAMENGMVSGDGIS